DAVERFWGILDWTDGVFEEFAGWYCGKTSPVHLFWHSLDLALTRFGGKRAPALAGADPVTQEAYTHEVVSFGFWAGDQNVRERTRRERDRRPAPRRLRSRAHDRDRRVRELRGARADRRDRGLPSRAGNRRPLSKLPQCADGARHGPWDDVRRPARPGQARAPV